MSTLPNAEEIRSIGRGFDPDPTRSSSIDTRCYIDPRFLRLEREQVFWRSWQFACHAEALREPGSYVTLDVQGRSIAALRGQDGQLRAFYNVCKHRGHELLSGSGKTRLITCPYHAWTYQTDGQLRAARGSEKVIGFDRQACALSAVQIEEFCSLIFVNLDLQTAPLAGQTGSLAEQITGYAPDLAQLTFAHRLTYTIEANWKSVVDNFLECYHCDVAHKDFVTLVDMDSYTVKTHGIWSSHMARAGLTDNKAYSVDQATVTDHAVWFLWPNTTLMRYPGRGNFMVWKFIPLGPEKTYEEFDIFLEDDSPNEAEKEALRFIDEVLQPEDIGLVESVQRGMNTPAFNSGRYMVDGEAGTSEHAVHHFHGLVLDAYRRACQS